MAGQTKSVTVTILGSGTCVPSLRRSACSVLLETDGARALFDCGAGTMRRLLEAGRTVFEVTHLFFSHFHPDHTGEMASFLFANKYPPASRRTQPLLMAGGRGFFDFMEKYKAVYGQWIELEASLLKMREFSVSDPDRFDGGDFTVSTRPVNHQPESIAFRVESSGKSVVYSGDTEEDENLVILSRGSDLLICESALPDDCKKEGHLTPSQAGRIAQKANVTTLVLTHLYPVCDEVDIKKQAAQFFSGPVIVAEDLMRFNL